jgi:hypothetical protein
LIDGEGCIGIYHHKVRCKKGKGNPYDSIFPRMTVANTSKEVMNYLIMTKIGSVKLHVKLSPNKSLYTWEISSPNQIKELLTRTKKFLIIKREQCQLLLDFLSKRVDLRNHRESNGRIKKIDIEKTSNYRFYLESKKLNKKGIER